MKLKITFSFAPWSDADVKDMNAVVELIRE